MKIWAVNLILVLSSVFAPAKGMVCTVFVLVLADLVSGVLAAKKQQLPITSAGIRRTVTKLFVYIGAILLAFLTQKYLTGEGIPVSSIVAGLIGLAELTSVFENLNILGDGKLLQSILDKLNSQNK